MRKPIILSLIAFILFAFNAFAYDNNVTHPELAKEATDTPEFTDIIVKNLGLPGGTKTRINGNTILKWLADGALLEDVPNCRASNHFFNPLDPWKKYGVKKKWGKSLNSE